MFMSMSTECCLKEEGKGLKNKENKVVVELEKLKIERVVSFLLEGDKLEESLVLRNDEDVAGPG